MTHKQMRRDCPNSCSIAQLPAIGLETWNTSGSTPVTAGFLIVSLGNPDFNEFLVLFLLTHRSDLCRNQTCVRLGPWYVIPFLNIVLQVDQHLD